MPADAQLGASQQHVVEAVRRLVPDRVLDLDRKCRVAAIRLYDGAEPFVAACPPKQVNGIRAMALRQTLEEIVRIPAACNFGQPLAQRRHALKPGAAQGVA